MEINSYSDRAEGELVIELRLNDTDYDMYPDEFSALLSMNKARHPDLGKNLMLFLGKYFTEIANKYKLKQGWTPK